VPLSILPLLLLFRQSTMYKHFHVSRSTIHSQNLSRVLSPSPVVKVLKDYIGITEAHLYPVVILSLFVNVLLGVEACLLQRLLCAFE
jgi:hypothetical protein